MGFDLKASSAKKLIQKGFKAEKCKTSLKLTMARMKLLKNKKAMHIAQMRREIGQLLENRQDETARIRVEHIINEEKTVAAYELIEMYCELIVVRLSMVESQKYCPIDLKEAVAGLMFASLRCADIPELTDIRRHFTLKYGKDFVKASMEVRTDSGVNPLIVGKLSARTPDVKTKLKVLTSIAKEHNIEWDPKSFEEQPKQQQTEGYLMGKEMGMESSGSNPSLSVDVELKNQKDSGPKIEEHDTSSAQKDLALKLYKEAGLEPGRGNSVDGHLHEMQESSAHNTSERVQQKLISPESNNPVGSDAVKDVDGIGATNGVKPERRRNQQKGSDGGSARDRYSKFITVSSVEDDFSAEQYAMELALRAEKLRMGTSSFDANQVSVEMLQQRNESHNFSEERQQSSSSLEAKKKSVVEDMNEVDYLRSESTIKESSENLNHGRSSINEDATSGRFGVVLEDNGNGGFGTNEASASNWMSNDSILDVFYNDGNLFSHKSSTAQYPVDQSLRRETSIDGFVARSSDYHINEEGPDDKHTNSRLTDEVIDHGMLDFEVNTSDGIVFPTIWTSRDDDLHSRSSSSEGSSIGDDLHGMSSGSDFVAFPSDNFFSKEAHQESLNLNFSNEEVKEEEEVIQESRTLKPEVVREDLESERILSNVYFGVNIFSITDEVKDGFPEASTSGKFDIQDDLQSEKLLMDHSLAELATTSIVIEGKQDSDRMEDNEENFPDMSEIIDDEMNKSFGVTVKDFPDMLGAFPEAGTSGKFDLLDDEGKQDSDRMEDNEEKFPDMSEIIDDEMNKSFGVTVKDFPDMSGAFPEASTSGKFDLLDDLQSEKLLMDHSLAESATTSIVIEGKHDSDRTEENEEIFPDMSEIIDDEMNKSFGVTVKYDDGEGDDLKEITFSSVSAMSPDRQLLNHDSSGDKYMELSSQNNLSGEDTVSSVFDLASKNSFDHEITENDDKLLSSKLELANHGYESNTHEVTWKSDIFKHGNNLNEDVKIDGHGITKGAEEEEGSFRVSSYIVFDDYDSDHNDCIDIFNIVNDISVDSAFSHKESESSVFNLNLEDQHRNELFVNDDSSLEINSTECSYSSLSEHTKEAKSVSNNISSGIYEGSCDSYSDYVDEIRSISIESVISDDNTTFVEEPCDLTEDAVDEKSCKKFDKEESAIPCFNSDSDQDEAPKLCPPVIPKKKLIWRSKNEPVDVEVTSSKPSDQNNRLNLNDQTVCSLSNSSPSTPKTPGSYESFAENLRRKWASVKVQLEMESVKKSPKPKLPWINTKTLKPSSMDFSLFKSESSSEEHTISEDDAGSLKSIGLESYESTEKQDSKFLASRLSSQWSSSVKNQQEMESVRKSPKRKPPIKNMLGTRTPKPSLVDLSLSISESSSEEHAESEDNAGSCKSLGLDSYWSTEKQDSKFLVSRLSSQQSSSVNIQQEMKSVRKSPKPKLQIENTVSTKTLKPSSVDLNLWKSESSPKEHIKSEDNAGRFRSLGLNSYESTEKQDSKFLVSRKLSQKPSKQVTVDEDLIQERPNSRSLTSYQSVKKKSNSKNLSTEEPTFEEQPPQVPVENRLTKAATLDQKGNPKLAKLTSDASVETSDERSKIPSIEMFSPASKSVERMEGPIPSSSKSNDSINEERDSKIIPPEQSVEKSSSRKAEAANIADKGIATKRNSEQPASTLGLSSPKTPTDGQIKKGYNVAYFQSLRSNYRRA